jgi:hypothetical protein
MACTLSACVSGFLEQLELLCYRRTRLLRGFDPFGFVHVHGLRKGWQVRCAWLAFQFFWSEVVQCYILNLSVFTASLLSDKGDSGRSKQQFQMCCFPAAATRYCIVAAMYHLLACNFAPEVEDALFKSHGGFIEYVRFGWEAQQRS